MYKQNYLKLAMMQDIDWLRAAMQSPSHYMTPMHVKLLAIAIRRKSKMA
jgi:hypothetical protein